MPKITEMVGKTFNRLTVISRAGTSQDRQATWNCLCACGVNKVVAGGHLRSGHTKSCGCFSSEQKATRSITHGMSNTPTLEVWKNMMNRCFNKNVPAYEDYGLRGITVCERWKDFNLFFKDMDVRPAELFLERVDNDLGYSPENCKWATRAEQARNTRRNKRLTIDGVTLVMADWAQSAGIKQSTLVYRLGKGMSPKEALSAGQHLRAMRKGA